GAIMTAPKYLARYDYDCKPEVGRSNTAPKTEKPQAINLGF
ncbi:MAG: hypothetical protein ACI9PC_001271, partial [Porticoccaceae bacterium]